MTKSPKFKIRRFRQIFVAFSEYVNFSLLKLQYQWVKVHISKMSNNQDIASKLSFMEFCKQNITYDIYNIYLVCVTYI